MTTVSCIQPFLLLQRRISCVREMGKTTKIYTSVTYFQCGHCDFTVSLSYNMHERTHLHNLQSLARCELIQCFYQCRFQWNARLKEITNTKDLNNKYKSVTPKIYFQTRQHWLTQRKLRWSKVFPSPKYCFYSIKPRGAYEIFGLDGKRLISGRREWG